MSFWDPRRGRGSWWPTGQLDILSRHDIGCNYSSTEHYRRSDTMTRTTIRGAVQYIRNGEDFDAGNLYGGATRSLRVLGMLPRHLLDFAYRDVNNGIDYAVYSYATPIAWRRQDGTWIYPEVSYSPSTNKHQGSVREALIGQHATQPGGLKLDR